MLAFICIVECFAVLYIDLITVILSEPHRPDSNAFEIILKNRAIEMLFLSGIA